MRCQIADKIIAHIGGSASVLLASPVTQRDAVDRCTQILTVGSARRD
jgi:hypothetical protein